MAANYKTTQAWFDSFPEPYRTKAHAALKLTNPTYDPDLGPCSARASIDTILWSQTTEGSNYWFFMERILRHGVKVLSKESVQNTLEELEKEHNA